MDLQTVLSNAVAASRQEELKTSPIMTLGELIISLEGIVKRQEEVKKKYDHEAEVVFDFASALPTGFGSWRGIYAELAVNYSFNGYGDMVGYQKTSGSSFDPKPFTVSEFLKLAKETVGKTFQGWKGGDFTMGKNTPLHVANDGDCGSTGIVGVRDDEYTVILVTATV